MAGKMKYYSNSDQMNRWFFHPVEEIGPSALGKLSKLGLS